MPRTQYVHKNYRGKPGPRAYSLTRPYVMLVTLTAEEYEYIGRRAINDEIHKTEYARQKMLPVTWMNDLVGLRQKQRDIPTNGFLKMVKRRFLDNGKK